MIANIKLFKDKIKIKLIRWISIKNLHIINKVKKFIKLFNIINYYLQQIDCVQILKSFNSHRFNNYNKSRIKFINIRSKYSNRNILKFYVNYRTI